MTIAIIFCFSEGCLFHFAQAVWRNIQRCGLTEAYRTDIEFQNWSRLILALPHLPTYEVGDFWLEQVIGNMPAELWPASQQLVDYVTNFWIDDATATFPIPVWNHFATQGSRSTNHLESWHKTLNDYHNTHSPNIFASIATLKKEQAKFEMKLAQLNHGAAPASKRQKYVRLEDRLQRLKVRLMQHELDIVRYATAISHLMGY
jgi:hypothetical protein